MSLQVKRHVLGVLALLLLVVALVVLFRAESNQGRILGSGCLRAGLTLGAMWLAFPQILALTAQFSPRMLATLLIGLLIFIVRPKSFPIVFLLILGVGMLELAGWVLKPDTNKRRRP